MDNSTNYQYLDGGKDEDSVETLDVGVGQERRRDGENLQRGDEAGAGRRRGRHAHVHRAAQVAYHVHAVGDVGHVAEPYQDCTHVQK